MNIKTFIVTVLTFLILLSVIFPTEVKAVGQEDILRRNLMNRIEKNNEQEVRLVNDTVSDYSNALLERKKRRLPILLFFTITMFIGIVFFVRAVKEDYTDIKILAAVIFAGSAIIGFLILKSGSDVGGSLREVEEVYFDYSLAELRQNNKNVVAENDIKSNEQNKDIISDKNSELGDKKVIKISEDKEVKDILNTIVDKVNSIDDKIDKNSERISNLEDIIKKLENKE